MAQLDNRGDDAFSIPTTLAGLESGLRRVSDWLSAVAASRDDENRVNLIFEEIVTNVVRYAFDDGGEHSITIKLKANPENLMLAFHDGGRPFDPRSVPRPPKPASLDDATIGGRRLWLVNSMARLDYERTPDGLNCLTVTLAREIA